MYTSTTRSLTVLTLPLLLNMFSCRKAEPPRVEASVSASLPAEDPEEEPADTAADTGNDTATDEPADATHVGDGELRFQFGVGDEPDTRLCDLIWDTSWDSTDLLCPDCEWTASVDLTLDEDRSTGVADCTSAGEADQTMILGYDADYFGEVGALWYYVPGYGDWYPGFIATWDEASGELYFSAGYYEAPSTYYYETYYYTSYWSGSATVQW